MTKHKLKNGALTHIFQLESVTLRISPVNPKIQNSGHSPGNPAHSPIESPCQPILRGDTAHELLSFSLKLIRDET
ncbi:MAG: hypothetical protein ACE362_12825 [Phaeodactylibacter xiamenensis]|uniref:hypothetical protein n=1 Tax=Phaeodactylibacter xiamenensis TaxID=1524460 RepID=UPI00391DE9C6